ncbi:right-handed parallel beta-helix repeat-containing protein [Deinococcus sp. VB343]|uniref:right-handed parallel beta-helix repeat-containing protein n=1 Tax=Deinococcus sp. VB343 TaxID=3385567 RepID=UPI0039C9D4B5
MSNCPTCGAAVPSGATNCPTCGSPLGGHSQTLPPGTLLAGGKYQLDRVLGQGGFGITYVASQTQLGSRIAIKELFPSGSTRQGGRFVLPPAGTDPAGWAQAKQDFTVEGRTVARFNHPDIVRVMDLFEENGTAYLVMEFLEGRTLGKAIEERGPLPPAEVATIASRVLGALSVVHSGGMLHRDIKPDNIYLDNAGRTVLIDFGSARDFSAGQTMSHTRLVTPGYAPLEQYSGAAKFGPYTDIYALGATLYHALTGHAPTAATDRTMGTPLAPLPASTPAPLRELIERSLEIKITDRPQSVEEAQAILGRAAPAPQARPQPQAPVAPVPHPAPQPVPQRVPAPQPVPQRRRAPGCGCLFPLLLLGGAALFGMNLLPSLLRSGESGSTQSPPSQTQPVPPVSNESETETQTPPDPAEPVNPELFPGVAPEEPAPPPAETPTEPPAETTETPSETPVTETPQTETEDTTTPTPDADQVTVFVSEANLRAAADQTSEVLGTLNAGTTLQVLQEQDGWYEVQTPEGQRGWLSGRVAQPLAGESEVQSLLAAAQNGGEVKLGPGVYLLTEPLVLAQNTRLIGAGRDQTFIASAAGDTVLTTRADVTLKGMTLQWSAATPGRVMLAEGGKVTLRDVRLTGAVRDTGKNEFGSGLWLAQGAQGDVQGSEFVGNAYGAYLSDSATLKASQTGLSDNSIAGAIFLDASGGELTGCSFDRNKLHGLDVQGTAAPRIADSAFRDNGGRGISVAGEATPEITGSKFQKNAKSGLAFTESASGSASGNDLSGNFTGIAVTGQARPALTDNVITGSTDAGLAYSGRAGGSASGNTVSSSAKPGISLWEEAKPTLEGNTVQGGTQSGVVYADSAGGTLRGNQILDNALHGLLVSDSAAPEVTDNTFRGNGKSAVLYKAQSGGRFNGNTCTGNGGDLIELQLADPLSGPDLSKAACAVQAQTNW